MARIVVTGATGRVGANIVKRLGENGHEVSAYLLSGDGQEAKLEGIACQKAYGDILDTQAVAAAIRGADAVVHSAAVMENVADKMPASQFFDINVKGAFNVLEAARHSGRPTHLICFSSASVYDVFTCPRAPLKETAERRPLSLYGLTKILVEDQVRQYGWHYDLRCTVLRPNYIVAGAEVLDVFTCGTVLSVLQGFADKVKCQLYAPEDPDGWLAAKPQLEANSDALCIPRCPGGQSWRWHMTDVRDVVDLVEQCLDNDRAVGQTFNIAARDACEWPQVVPYVAQCTQRKVVDVQLPNLWQFSFDQSAARDALGFVPRCDHKAIVDTAVQFSRGEQVGIIAGEIAALAFEAAG